MKKKSASTSRRCTMGAPEAEICKTAKDLAGLFNRVETDAPDALLTHSPAPKNTVDALRVLLDVMFPGKISATPVDGSELGVFLIRRLSETWRLLHREIRRALPYRWIGEAARVEGARPPKIDNLDHETDRILKAFLDTLPGVRKLLVADVQAAYDGDPAALTFAEVLLSYPGLLAIAAHRIAHELYKLRVPIIPRIMSEWIHTKSGTDIHPGARIGHAFFIDHATGVVIGETTEIGDHVKLYQGVTLGARSFALGLDGMPVKHVKRHPTVQDHVIVYANATILGGETVIGARSVIGSNVFLMESVPPDSIVSSNHPELSIREKKRAKKT
ncbi:MAG: serine O-acetyltransferase EpsC [Kiritimatiellia bacterium]